MMGIAVELENLTTAEKIGIMERLWEDLCRNASDTLSPSWHGDILTQREGAVTVGEACFVDWDEAKKRFVNRYEKDSPSGSGVPGSGGWF